MSFKTCRKKESILITFPDDAIFLTEKESSDEVFLIIIIIIFSSNNRLSFEREKIWGKGRLGLVRVLSKHPGEKIRYIRSKTSLRSR